MASLFIPGQNRLPCVHLVRRRLFSTSAQAVTLAKNVMNDLVTEAGSGYHALQRTGVVPVQRASGKSRLIPFRGTSGRSLPQESAILGRWPINGECRT